MGSGKKEFLTQIVETVTDEVELILLRSAGNVIWFDPIRRNY